MQKSYKTFVKMQNSTNEAFNSGVIDDCKIKKLFISFIISSNKCNNLMRNNDFDHISINNNNVQEDSINIRNVQILDKNFILLENVGLNISA